MPVMKAIQGIKRTDLQKLLKANSVKVSLQLSYKPLPLRACVTKVAQSFASARA